MQQAKTPDSHSLLLTNLVRLEKRVRQSQTQEELRFIAVNETLALVNYQQAVIGNASKGVLLLSGISDPDLNAPYVLWCKGVFKYLAKQSVTELRTITSVDLPKNLQSEWETWLQPHMTVLPLTNADTSSRDRLYLLLARAKPFVEGEKALLREWAELLAFHLNARRRSSISWLGSLSHRSLFRPTWILLGLIVASFFIPVRLTVLAPAEVSADNPALLRSPLEGVIAEVLVKPNQRVTAGETLFRFDDRNLKSQMQVTSRELETAQAVYRQAAQQAVFDGASKNRLALLQAEIETSQIDLAQINELLSRTEVLSPIDGEVLFGSALDWEGRPVSLGEKLVLVADPSQVKVKGWLSPSDQVPLDIGSAVTLFDSSRPDAELTGQLESVAYQTVERPDGSFAFLVEASLDQGVRLPPIGSRGTLRLEGEQVSLAYMLTRRPLALLRQWLGA